MTIKSVEEWVKILENKGFNQAKNQAEWLVLRPNDMKLTTGEISYHNIWNALEIIMKAHIDDERYQELKKYFYFMANSEEHGF